jgi:hypothetical protein
LKRQGKSIDPPCALYHALERILVLFGSSLSNSVLCSFPDAQLAWMHAPMRMLFPAGTFSTYHFVQCFQCVNRTIAPVLPGAPFTLFTSPCPFLSNQAFILCFFDSFSLHSYSVWLIYRIPGFAIIIVSVSAPTWIPIQSFPNLSWSVRSILHLLSEFQCLLRVLVTIFIVVYRNTTYDSLRDAFGQASRGLDVIFPKCI